MGILEEHDGLQLWVREWLRYRHALNRTCTCNQPWEHSVKAARCASLLLGYTPIDAQQLVVIEINDHYGAYLPIAEA